jgi:23S rRNA pseudouridine1911/1915/1917 synthase
MPMPRTLETVIPESNRGERLDQALAGLFPDYSRTRLKTWIEAGRVLVDGLPRRPRDLVTGGERVRVEPELDAPQTTAAAQAIELDLAYEDESLIVVNKPAGLVVHPGAGNPDRTLQNALLHHDPSLATLPRAGIIHRLDKDTSGLLVIARDLVTHTALTRLLAARDVAREYVAVAVGEMTGGGRVEAPIGRHAVDRLRMAVRADGRPAVTHYRVLGKFRGYTHVQVRLETGRTHQIRVHLAHAGYPIVGDPLYGRRRSLPPAATPQLTEALRGFRRQALHAARLAFKHPRTGKDLEVTAPVPADFEHLLGALRADLAAARAAEPDPRR